MPQAILQIDDRSVIDRDAFRTIFPPAFGFLDFHGRNSNAWVDCMPGPDDPGARVWPGFMSGMDKFRRGPSTMPMP